MGKMVIVISAGVTAFILALTAGAVYAYRTMTSNGISTTAQQPVSQAAAPLQLAALPTPTDVPNVSPQDAASIASKSINRTDLYSVELADVQGTQAYKVTFSSGDVVYVGMTGQVVATVPPPPANTIVTTISGGSGGGGGGGHGGGGYDGEGEHEGGGD